ncbi:MAG: helix-turn-helix domain-containing protein [Paracoccaceae bacterium]
MKKTKTKDTTRVSSGSESATDLAERTAQKAQDLTQQVRVDTLVSMRHRESWRSDFAQSFEHPVLFWLTRGQGRFMLDCKMRGVGPNTLVFIPKNTLFSYELFAQPQGTVVTLQDDPALGFAEDPVLLQVASGEARAEVSGLIETLNRELLHPRPGQHRAIHAQIMMLSVWLDRMCAQMPATKLGKSDRILRRFSRIVSIHHREGRSLGEFAADLEVTPTHLTRLTKGAVGKPASALLQERVIHAACDALARTDGSVKEIAQHLGFSSPAYFTRAFQSHTGQSPSAFRRLKR